MTVLLSKQENKLFVLYKVILLIYFRIFFFIASLVQAICFALTNAAPPRTKVLIYFIQDIILPSVCLSYHLSNLTNLAQYHDFTCMSPYIQY